MPLLTPDPTFYPSARMAMQARPETLAYMALINPTRQGKPDAIGVVEFRLPLLSDHDADSHSRCA